ncbi:MAG TPA: hypothetical protein DDZ81_03575 [Acetobacteraceae bacterium]|jgi:uncharacterized protein|nr:hypothetical protein [Acetobacteraceae bacterium]
MEYFFYCRDNPDTGAVRKAVLEAHWSFMDGYADRMIARGPTLTPDRSAPTGSMHILDLPDDAAVRRFAFEEPYYKAGVFRDVMVRRWRNALGRTMWQFRGDPENNQRFLVIGHGKPGVSNTRDGLLEAHRRYFVENGYQEHFIARGPLLSDDESEWVGSAMLIELPSRAAVEAMLADEPYVRAGLYADIEILDWRFGGRH